MVDFRPDKSCRVNFGPGGAEKGYFTSRDYFGLGLEKRYFALRGDF